MEDERIKRFIEIMEKEYSWTFSEDQTEEIYEVVDRVEREISKNKWRR